MSSEAELDRVFNDDRAGRLGHLDPNSCGPDRTPVLQFLFLSVLYANATLLVTRAGIHFARKRFKAQKPGGP
jgi:hypothetical protein